MNLKLVMLLALLQSAQLEEYKTDKNILFQIERSKDQDKIIYEVNWDKNGQINSEEPLVIHWIRASNNKKEEKLTWIQNKYAYGVKVLSQEDERVVFQFVSYDKKSFTLTKTQNGIFTVTGEFDGKEIAIERIFIQIDGGSFWLPKITKIDIFGTCINSEKQYISTIRP
ncbi:DUF4833 domain-containing protein [Fontibacter flavus]|uniref:DUF4833 domain-containing protein n=1 Tax=Fontibacter flavus TaxID=654838 RepID=A0ABV6FWW6_9BACT